MWWLTHALPPLATANVFFSSAPQASRWRPGSTGSGSAAGTCPRERRSSCGLPALTRTTESSVRVAIGRSWSRNRSAMPAQPLDRVASSKAIGSSETLPLVITSAAARRPAAGGAAASRAASRRARATAAPPLRRAARPRRGGRARSAARSRAAAPPRRRVRSTSARAASRSGAISANGLSSRCLRARSAATALSSSARQARWKPPIPLIATTAPARSARAAAATGSSASRIDHRLPAGVDEPRRRPAARAGVGLGVEAAVGGVVGTRRGTAAHISKPAIVVAAGRTGRRRTIVKRGPQFGAVDERVAVAPVGRVEQLGQAVRAGRGVGRDRGARLAAGRARRIAKPRSPRSSSGSETTRSTRRERRRLGGRRARKRSTARPAPRPRPPRRARR